MTTNRIPSKITISSNSSRLWFRVEECRQKVLLVGEGQHRFRRRKVPLSLMPPNGQSKASRTYRRKGEDQCSQLLSRTASQILPTEWHRLRKKRKGQTRRKVLKHFHNNQTLTQATRTPSYWTNQWNPSNQRANLRGMRMKRRKMGWVCCDRGIKSSTIRDRGDDEEVNR